MNEANQYILLTLVSLLLANSYSSKGQMIATLIFDVVAILFSVLSLISVFKI